MDDKTLQELKDKVNTAETLSRQIKTMDDVIASCNAEVGFLNLTMNHNQQNAIPLVNSGFTAREVFDAFKDDVKAAAIKYKTKLEADYKNLK